MKRKLVFNQSRRGRWLLMLLTLFVVSVGMQAQDILVGGVGVTSANAGDVMGDGTVSWNDDSKTLTLNGATINGGITSNLTAGFNIHLTGTNTVNATADGYVVDSTPEGWQPITITADEGAMLLTNVDDVEKFFRDYNQGRMYEADLPEDYVMSKDMLGIYHIAKRYDVYLESSIGTFFGQQYVTQANYDRLLGSNGVATVTYDPTTNTLTLNNMDEEGCAPYGTTYFINVDGYDSQITIHLVGKNTLRNRSDVGDVSFASASYVTFTTDDDNPGSLTITDIDTSYDYGEDFMFSGKVAYQNGLAYSKDDNGNHYVRVPVEGYGISVGGIEVTKENADNVMGDDLSEEWSVPTVTFDPEKNELTLHNAQIDMSEVTGMYAIQSDIQDLKVKLIGNNSVMIGSGSDWPYVFGYVGNEETATLTLQTEGDEWGGYGSLYADGVEGLENLCQGYALANELTPMENEQNGWGYAVEENWSSSCLAVSYVEYYDVWIGSSRLTSSNRNGGHSGDINYTDEDHTLFLGGITYSFVVKSHLTDLTIRLANSNTIADAVFEATDEVPSGTLTLVADDESAVLDLYTESEQPFAGFSQVNYQNRLYMTYIPGEWSYYHIAVKQLEEPGYHFADEIGSSSYYSSGSTVYNLNFGEENSLPVLDRVPEGLPITYSSNNEAVATIDQTGKITLTGAGYVWISASNEETDAYQAHEERIKLEIRPSDPQASMGQGVYYPGEKLTMIATVPNGEMYYSLNWGNDKVKYTEPIELQKGETTVSLYTYCSSEDGEMWSYGNNHPTFYVYDQPTASVAAGTYNDDLKVTIGHLPEDQSAQVCYFFNQELDDDFYESTDMPDENAYHVYEKESIISIIEGKVLKVFIMKQDSGRYYKSKPVETQYTVIPKTELNISYAGNQREWASYYTNESLETPSGLQAYIVTEASKDDVRVSTIDYIPGEVPVLLKRMDAVEEPIVAKAYIEEETADASANMLAGTEEGLSVSQVDGNVYVLYNDGFTRATRGTIPAHRSFLVLNQEAGARLMIWDDEETTRLSTADGDAVATNTEIYNLNGQRISKPTKGLYISNGRKKIAK